MEYKPTKFGTNVGTCRDWWWDFSSVNKISSSISMLDNLNIDMTDWVHVTKSCARTKFEKSVVLGFCSYLIVSTLVSRETRSCWQMLPSHYQFSNEASEIALFFQNASDSDLKLSWSSPYFPALRVSNVKSPVLDIPALWLPTSRRKSPLASPTGPQDRGAGIEHNCCSWKTTKQKK